MKFFAPNFECITGKACYGMDWNGKWYGLEGEFWYGILKMLRMEWHI